MGFCATVEELNFAAPGKEAYKVDGSRISARSRWYLRNSHQPFGQTSLRARRQLGLPEQRDRGPNETDLQM